MGTLRERCTNSMAFWTLVVIFFYFVYALYFAIYGLQFSLQLTHDQYVYNLVSRDPWWWQILYYGSEGVAGSVAIILRAFAGLFALKAAFTYWNRGSNSMPAVRKNAVRAIALEAGFFLALIPSVIAAFAYNFSSEYLFYFDHTPEQILLFGTAIPCLAIVLIVPPVLLKLRAKISKEASTAELYKWIALAGVSYLFVVFWFNYSMLWAASMVPYPRVSEVYGITFLLQPTNLLSFGLTFFGLLAVSMVALTTVLPVIRKQPCQISCLRIGIIMASFGGYFLFNTLYYALTGGYEAHPSVWYEVIGPLHNPNLWSLAFIFTGIPLIIKRKLKKIDCNLNKIGK